MYYRRYTKRSGEQSARRTVNLTNNRIWDAELVVKNARFCEILKIIEDETKTILLY